MATVTSDTDTSAASDELTQAILAEKTAHKENVGKATFSRSIIDMSKKSLADERDDCGLFCDQDASRSCGEAFNGMLSLKGMFSSKGRTRSAAASRSMDATVTRKEIFSLSKSESQRFVDAVKKLMENNAAGEPETSEWFRIAGYHGWPSDYCSHGEETFPSWHRAYLLEMEKALRKADEELGNDGNIGLPYWDWIKNPQFPPIIRENFTELPPNFFQPNGPGASITLNRRNSDETIELNLRNANLKRLVDESLEVDEHWKHASTRWRRGSSVEAPHNSVHVAIGYPMSSVAHAAFDPVFWLHHANIDRIHEAYLMRHPDSREEFEATQRRLAQERGETDRFAEWLDPFTHPKTGTPFLPTDSFDLKDLGYKYDDTMEPAASIFGGVTQRALTLLGPAKSTLAGTKVHCLFRDVQVLPLKKKSYALYVFIFADKEKGAAWNSMAQETSVKTWVSMPEFAGMGAIFGGKGSECSNCQTRKPYNVFVEVTKAIKRCGISSIDDWMVRVVAVDEQGTTCMLEDTPIPTPVLVRDSFDIQGPQLNLGSKGSDIRDLQKRLTAAGAYTGKIDRDFGPKTEEALKSLQEFHGLKSDGIAGPITKELLTYQRYDSIQDSAEQETVKPLWASKSNMKYWLGVCPGYLQRDSLLKELVVALHSWKEVCDIEFDLVEDENQADIKIQFVDDINEDAIGSRSGGDLGRVGENFIHLDASRRWLLSGEGEKSQSFKFNIVILHLMGHLLGFDHVANKSSVMYPIYDPNKTELKAVDRALLCSGASF